MAEIVHQINGKTYVSIDVAVVQGFTKEVRAFRSKHGLLFQSVKDVVPGRLLSRGYAIETYLCPEENYESCAKEIEFLYD